MQATVFIHDGKGAQWGDSTALAFCEAWLAENHRLAAVVFYHEASMRLEGAGDLHHPALQWCQLSRQHFFPLLVCAAAASRRGISADPVATVSFGRLLPVGLATILDAVDHSDRTLTFSS